MEQFVLRVENDERDLAVAKDTQLVSFFHQTEFPLSESNLKDGKYQTVQAGFYITSLNSQKSAFYSFSDYVVGSIFNIWCYKVCIKICHRILWFLSSSSKGLNA